MQDMDTHIGTGIRTGAQYLEGLRDDREIWTGGKRIADVTAAPGIANGAATLGAFLDRQHDPDYQDKVTYLDADGRRCATSFMVPKSVEDVKAKGAAFYEWATWSNGMFGRTPDYKNASVMAFAAATGFLAQNTKGQGDYAANMVKFYDHVRTNDKVLTHTLVNPQISHAQAKAGKFSADVALHVTRETDAGIYVSGARLLATLGPSADEIEVFPSTVLKADPDNVPFAFAFAIPIATPGLKMICRDTY
ncbi:MAG: 4-hydroxyphenylacetate 3-hydroxylase N-terminal domain-containing protein, partial [Primorskyibacter sp.]